MYQALISLGTAFLASAVLYHILGIFLFSSRCLSSVGFSCFLSLHPHHTTEVWTWWLRTPSHLILCDFPAVVPHYRRAKRFLRWGAETFSLNTSRHTYQPTIFLESRNWFYIICILNTCESSNKRNTIDIDFNNQDNQNPKWNKYFLFLRLKNFILDHPERKPSKIREDRALENI